MITETDARELLHAAAEGYGAHPAPITYVLESGAEALTRPRRRRVLVVVSGSVVALLVGIAWLVPQASDRPNGPVSPPTTAAPDGWQNMTGLTLANALGLTLVPQAEVKTALECTTDDGTKKDVIVVLGNPDAVAYCYLASDYGITDPVESRLMGWQLFGVPRTDRLVELATVSQQLADLMRNNGGNHVTPERLPRLQALMEQKEQLENQLFAPQGNLIAWLLAHAEPN